MMLSFFLFYLIVHLKSHQDHPSDCYLVVYTLFLSLQTHTYTHIHTHLDLKSIIHKLLYSVSVLLFHLYYCYQSGIQPPASVHKHDTTIAGKGKGFSLTGRPIWASWSLPFSKPFSPTKHRKQPATPKTRISV